MSSVPRVVSTVPQHEAAGRKVLDIQVLRGISILAVLFCHLSLTPTLLDLMPVKVTMPLYLGVEVFFVVSGYVIVRSLIDDGCSAARFFVKRLFRLTPAILVFVAISAALNAVARHPGLPEFPRTTFATNWDDFGRQSLSVTCGYFLLLDGPTSYMNGAMWSLSVEDQFYAALAVACLAAGLVFRNRPRAVVGCLLTAACVLYIAIGSLRIAVLTGAGWAAAAPAWIWYLADWRFDFLALGVIIGVLDRPLSSWLVAPLAQAGTHLSAWLLAVPFAVVALCESPFAFRAPILFGFGLPLSGLSFGLLLLLASRDLAFPSRRGQVYGLMVYLGNRSYTIYLLHFPAFVAAWLVTYWWLPAAFSDALRYGTSQLVVSMLLLLPVVEVVYKRVELPLMRVGRNLAMQMKRRGQPATVGVVVPVATIPFRPVAEPFPLVVNSAKADVVATIPFRPVAAPARRAA